MIRSSGLDKLLYDMQNDIANVAAEYVQPMNEYFGNMLTGINSTVNGNRQEMKNLAEKLQSGLAEDGAAYTEEEANTDGDYEA